MLASGYQIPPVQGRGGGIVVSENGEAVSFLSGWFIPGKVQH